MHIINGVDKISIWGLENGRGKFKVTCIKSVQNDFARIALTWQR